MVKNPSIRPYFLGGGVIAGGALRFPWSGGNVEMLQQTLSIKETMFRRMWEMIRRCKYQTFIQSSVQMMLHDQGHLKTCSHSCGTFANEAQVLRSPYHCRRRRPTSFPRKCNTSKLCSSNKYDPFVSSWVYFANRACAPGCKQDTAEIDHTWNDWVLWCGRCLGPPKKNAFSDGSVRKILTKGYAKDTVPFDTFWHNKNILTFSVFKSTSSKS